MKAFLCSLILLSGVIPMHAKDKPAQDKHTLQALERLDKKLDTAFTIPFPSEQLDIDRYLTQSLGLITVDGKRVRVTKPILNPYDGAHSIEWLVGPEDAAKFGKEHVQCFFNFNDKGDFVQIGMLANDSWTTAEGGANSLSIKDGEQPATFFNRAIGAFRLRAKKAKDPAQAELVVSAFEKISLSLQALRNEELALKP